MAVKVRGAHTFGHITYVKLNFLKLLGLVRLQILSESELNIYVISLVQSRCVQLACTLH